jgi:hypothetical protein
MRVVCLGFGACDFENRIFVLGRRIEIYFAKRIYLVGVSGRGDGDSRHDRLILAAAKARARRMIVPEGWPTSSGSFDSSTARQTRNLLFLAGFSC